jgi:hypothetical protein
MQFSFLDGDEFECFYFVTDTEMALEKVVIAYGKLHHTPLFEFISDLGKPIPSSIL